MGQPRATLETLLALLRAMLYMGVRHAPTATLQRKVVQVNIATPVALATIAVFNVFFWQVGNEALIRSGLAQIPVGLALLGVYVLHHRGWLETARWGIFLLVMLDVLVGMAMGQGNYTGIHSYYILFAVLTALFFPVDRWGSALFLALVNIGLFVFFQIIEWKPHASMHEINLQFVNVVRTIMYASCVVIVVVLMLHNEIATVRNERELQAAAATDPLTQLPNRRAFRTALQRDLARAIRDKSTLAVALVDVDFFKRVNDQYGHDMGDQVLQLLAQLLREQMRAADLVARIGGEEFAILMPQTNLEQARVLAERMREAVALRRFGAAEAPFRLSISVGLATVGYHLSEEQILKAADKALYLAKNKGRNRVVAEV